MGTFAIDVSKWGDKAMKDFDRLRRAVIIELFSSVILDTPVQEGRLRGNWQIASTVVKGEVNVTDPQGNSTIANIGSHLNKEKVEADNVTVLTNNLPYAYKIEYDGWSHTKAPEGMVRKNFIRISQNLKKHNG